MRRSSNSPTKPSSLGGRPPQATKFGRNTPTGRVGNLSRDDDIDMSSEATSQNDYNYTVMMPPTPNNNNQQGMNNNNNNDSGGGGGESKIDRRMSSNVLNSSNNKSMLLRSQTQDFDHNRWLFETKGTYGIGNAYWQDDNNGMSMSDFMDKPWKPLTRKVQISGGILSPYRLLIGFRLIVQALFLTWRIRNPNYDAMWLWGISIVCEIWFFFSWIIDVLPKLNPINRSADLTTLHEKFYHEPSPSNPIGRSDLPGIDIIVTTFDPVTEPPLVTANTILSVLGVEYPIEKLSCYILDDGAAILTFEAMAEAVKFAEIWVPFCRKHKIEPRNPEAYFNLKKDPTKNKKRPDFVKDRRWMKREYDEFKVRINRLPELIQKRNKMYNSREQKKEKQILKEKNGGVIPPDQNIDNVPIATWMDDGTHWPGTWLTPTDDHSKGDHAAILQVMSKAPEQDPVMGYADEKRLDFTGVDIRIPMLAYVSRERRLGYDHNNKAGAMNAMVRASAILSNGPFILNLDCDHYIYNSIALKEGICFMLDRGGDRYCFVQFPQRFEGIDPSDRYANHNTVFFDGNMRALDGLQGPIFMGTGCLFRRYALYGFEPPRFIEHTGMFGRVKTKVNRNVAKQPRSLNPDEEYDKQSLTSNSEIDDYPQKFGNSSIFTDSIPIAEFRARPLADHKSVRNGRPPGALLIPRLPLDAPTVAEAITVISCWFEEKTEWGIKIGWIYGSATEDVVTGYTMHNRGWRSIYCITKRDAFRDRAPINLTDRLHQVLKWATGSVEIFFSRYNPLFASRRLKFLQRIAYLNFAIYPFTSIYIVMYCFIPAMSLFSGQFIVQGVDVSFLTYLFLLSICITLISLLEVRWSEIALEEWWRNEQFWVIGGTSAHLVAVLQGMLKVITGIQIECSIKTNNNNKSGGNDENIEGGGEYAEFYIVKWTSLFIMPLTIIIVNLIALVMGFLRTVYSVIPQWSKLMASAFFSFWVLSHMYPFAKGLMGKKGRVPTIVYVWSGLLSITIALLWISIDPPTSDTGGGMNMMDIQI